MFYSGKEVKKDLNKAFLYFDMSSKKQNTEANYWMALLSLWLWCTKNYFTGAIQYYELAAEKGNSYAINNLGNTTFD